MASDDQLPITSHQLRNTPLTMHKKLFPFIMLLLFTVPGHSEDIPLEFNDAGTQHRYLDLIEEIRCLVCQNQSLADSHADLAQDLRQEIFDMITAGKTNDEILEFLVQRYGDFVLYRPPFKGSTVLLWLLPFIFLIVAVITVIYFVRFRSADAESTELSLDDREKLNRVLQGSSEGSDRT